MTNPGYLGAVAAPCQNWPELIESNNSRAGKLIGIGWGPDFVVQSVVGPASAEPGHVGAVADPGLFLPELIKSNNARASGVVQFQY
ncbi:MAG TPA: hypothetical protein VK539_38040 [Myxococcaceae bacterium]|nr:hypothetical protein [Myxococcaceae bacterium]